MGITPLPVNVIAEIQHMAALSPQKEICGVIADDYTIHPVTNVASKPQHCFIFNKHEYFKLLSKLVGKCLSILAIYHSHPSGDCTPSKADIDFVRNSRRNSLIVTRDSYRWIECPDSLPTL